MIEGRCLRVRLVFSARVFDGVLVQLGQNMGSMSMIYEVIH